MFQIMLALKSVPHWITVKQSQCKKSTMCVHECKIEYVSIHVDFTVLLLSHKAFQQALRACDWP